MGSTHVSLREGSSEEDPYQIPGFWMRDDMLELWLRLLALNIEPREFFLGCEDTEESELARRIRDKFLSTTFFYWPGCVPHGLEEIAETATGLAILRKAVVRLNKALETAKSFSADALNLLGFDWSSDGTPWQDPVDGERLREVGRAFLDLIDGKIEGANHDCQFMPGTSPKREQI